MIISQTPFRISFFGGGTDYPQWYRENGGAVLGTTIDKYCQISCRFLPPFFEYKHRLVYSVTELVNEFSEIRHPAIRECLKFLPPGNGVEVHHDGDLPARSGLGSSSAFTVGMIHTLHALRGEMISKMDLAKQALHVEQNLIGEAVGSQDQVAACFGGLNHIVFRQDGSFNVTPVILSAGRRASLHDHLMLFFTGFQRNAFEIASKQIENFPNTRQQLLRIQSMVDEGLGILGDSSIPIERFGELLHEGWVLKRSLAQGVSTSEIDQIYNAGRSAGALGGKLLGAGGGGFILFFVKPEDQARVRARLASLVHVSFAFETQGSRIILYDPNL